MNVTPEQHYGQAVFKDVMVTMRDGIRLATDVYRPTIDGRIAEGTFPTILGRTSYDKTSTWMWIDPVANVFTPRGYVVVLQDVRGRYRSEDVGNYFHTANPNEGPDGFDTIEWIAAQEWSNGRVGMVGSSHNAIVQQVAALHCPPHLTAIWPDVGPTNIYAHMSREGGAMALQMFGAIFMHAYQEVDAPVGARAAVERAMMNMSSWVFRTPFKPGHTPLAPFPHLEKTLFDYYWRGCYDEFWSQECCDQEAHWSRHADIPAVYSGGWADPFSAATTHYFSTMARQNSASQRLIMGPWDHDAMRTGSAVVGDVDFGEFSVWGPERYAREQVRWFDRWLKERPNGVEDDQPVSIFVMGGGGGGRTAEGHLFHGGQWREEQEWPPLRTEHRNYYLRGDGRLTLEAPAEDEPARSFTYDPADPVPTIGGNVASFYEMVAVPEIAPNFLPYIPWAARMRNIVPAGSFNQREEPWVVGARPPYLSLASRQDVLVFETTPLEEPLEVTGAIRVSLCVSSSAPDTDFTAKLIDVYPPSPDYPEGYDLGLVDSIIRARYRDGWESETFMRPMEVYTVVIWLPPVSNLFETGHRLRLDVSSSNFPRFDLNPNTGEPMGRHTHIETARNTIHLSHVHPSTVVVPTL